jgi:hypothetical protein
VGGIHCPGPFDRWQSGGGLLADEARGVPNGVRPLLTWRIAIGQTIPAFTRPLTGDRVSSDERAFEHADLGPFDGLRVVDLNVENAGEGEPNLSAVEKPEDSVVVEDVNRAGIGTNELDGEHLPIVALRVGWIHVPCPAERGCVRGTRGARLIDRRRCIGVLPGPLGGIGSKQEPDRKKDRRQPEERAPPPLGPLSSARWLLRFLPASQLFLGGIGFTEEVGVFLRLLAVGPIAAV